MAFSKEKAHERAERFAARGQHEKAAREYQAIVEHDPRDVRAWLMLADCLVRCGDRKGAIGRYLQVGDYYAQQKQPQKALAVYRQVLALDPARMDVQLKCADLNLELKKIQDAIVGYEEVAHAQLQLGKTQDAIRLFKLAAELDPQSVAKRLRLAELLSREKMVEAAVESFRIAGGHLLASGRSADFIRVAERLIYHRNDDQPTLRQLARVYLELGDPRRALIKLNALLQSNPHDPEGLELLAETFMSLQKPDKAISVIVELVRELRASDPGAKGEALRVIRLGLSWDPQNPVLLERQAELLDLPEPSVKTRVDSPSAGSASDARHLDRRVDHEMGHDLDEDVDEELDAEEVLELGEDDVILDTTHATAGHDPGGDSAPAHASAAQASRSENTADLDKILFEARVYVKYRLFEHALEHLQSLLVHDPEHIGALSLRARTLGELDRKHEAAQVHIAVARLLADRDPKLAKEHLAAALELVPGHEEAVALAPVLPGRGTAAAEAPFGAHPAVPTPASDLGSLEVGFEGDGESAPFDLLTGEHQINSETTMTDLDFEIDLSDAPERTPHREQDFPVEDRFGLGSSDDSYGELTSEFDEVTLEPGAVEIRSDGDRTSAFGTAVSTEIHDDRTAAEQLDESLESTRVQRAPNLEHDILDEETRQLDAIDDELASNDALQAIDWTAAKQGDDGFDASFARDLEPDLEPDLELDEHESEALEEFERDVSVALELTQEEPAPEKTVVPASPAPQPAARGTAWPDVSDDLAEVRFYLDQGLEDDARAALAELQRKHPGHPDLEALVAQLGRSASAVEADAATPLVDIDEEDEEDAYLSAIFSGKPAAPRKQREAQALAELGEVDSRTLFDLGMAYREMGLIDDAIAQFEGAAKDALWQCRALVMIATLRVHHGETERAVTDLRKAIAAARNEDERCEANYELGVLYEKIGDRVAAIEQLREVTEGFRDRDERLGQLLG